MSKFSVTRLMCKSKLSFSNVFLNLMELSKVKGVLKYRAVKRSG